MTNPVFFVVHTEGRCIVTVDEEHAKRESRDADCVGVFEAMIDLHLIAAGPAAKARPDLMQSDRPTSPARPFDPTGAPR